jgi:ABC-type bacteriocin/lantibiotic exporter with double-glycine peptidase domain
MQKGRIRLPDKNWSRTRSIGLADFEPENEIESAGTAEVRSEKLATVRGTKLADFSPKRYVAQSDIAEMLHAGREETSPVFKGKLALPERTRFFDLETKNANVVAQRGRYLTAVKEQEAEPKEAEIAKKPSTAKTATGQTQGQEQEEAQKGRNLLRTLTHDVLSRRVPALQQVSMVECGAACLAMILTYYGRKTSISEVRERCRVGRDGLSALTIVKAARNYGLRVRAISLQKNDFRFVTLPAIIHWEFNHFLVVERWSPKWVDVVDPAVGRRRLTSEEFNDGFTGVVLMFEPGVHFDRHSAVQPMSLWTYLRSMLQAPGVLAQLLGASLVLQMLGLALPFLTQLIVDHVIPSGMSNMVMLVGTGMLILVLTQLVTSLLRTFLLIYLQARIDKQMMLHFFEHLLALPYRFFQQRLSGDLLARLSSNTAIRDILTDHLISTILDGSFVIMYLAILLLQSLLFGGVVLAIGILQLLLLLTTVKPLRGLAMRDLIAQGKSQAYMNEALSGIATLKAAGAEERTFHHWSNLFFQQLNISIRRNYLGSLVNIAMGSLNTFSSLLLLWLGTVQVLHGSMSLGTMLELTTLTGSILTPLASFVSSALGLQIVRAHFERIADVVAAAPEQDIQTVQPPPRLSGEIELKNVSFQYDPDAPEILSNISIRIEPGQKVALVGQTGSGKSTLGKLLLGLITPTQGDILYDHLSLQNLNYQEVRQQFGVVMQESFVFSDSIRKNIAFNAPSMRMEQVVQAAKAAAIHNDILQMPMKYETLVAEGGSALSGGQRQRIALARALAHVPSVLLLDEATSHLDVATEQEVEQNLDTLACTRIIIAHRLSTIRNADIIFVLDHGRIVEQGSHNELLQRNGYYAKLIQCQLENDVREVA